MFLLLESDVNQNICVLDDAWSQPDTFLFVPEKDRGSEQWITRVFRELPQALRTHHFGLLTSGSTGLPKVVIGSRQRAEKLAAVLHELQQSHDVQETILTLPLTYCYAFVNQWLWARHMKRLLVVTHGFKQPDRLYAALHKARKAMVCLVGAQIPLFVKYFPAASFSGVTRVHFAGGSFPESQWGVLGRMFPNAQIYNNYGCAEAMPRLSLRCVAYGETNMDIGTPLPGVELHANEQGELCFRSPFSSVAYIDAEGFHDIGDRWVKTGDMAVRESHGRWRIVGRANEVFKRYGEKIALPSLKEAIMAHWTGQAAFYREKDVAGEDGHVLVVAPQPTPPQLKELLQTFRQHFARVYWPLRIESTIALPLLSNGKVDVLALSKLKDKTVHWNQRISGA